MVFEEIDKPFNLNPCVVVKSIVFIIPMGWIMWHIDTILKITVLITITFIRRKRSNPEKGDYMEELITKLNAIPNSYFEFVDTVVEYAEEKEAHLRMLIEYLNNTPSATPSDVLKFITFQPDFFDDEIDESLLVG